MSHLLSLLSPLWPALMAWLALVLPIMAWNASTILQSEELDCGLLIRGAFWTVAHVWPYSVIARARERLEAVLTAGLSPETLVTSVHSQNAPLSSSWLPRQLPARLDLGLPPRSMPEADIWLARTDRGGTLSE